MQEMSSGSKFKEEFERAIAQKFLELKFNKQPQQYSCEILRKGNSQQKEPDIICSDGSSIEIVTSYDNQSQAQRYWEEIKGIIKPLQIHELCLYSLEQLTNVIYAKLTKLNNGLYSGTDESKIILLCYCVSPLFNHRSAEEIKHQYMPFKLDNYFDKYFSETWIIWWEGGDTYQILKLE